ncbi:MAG: hypothetical protein ACLU71_13540 [Blautia hansenii]
MTKIIRGENMNFDYAKDSKEQRPYEHYLSAYKSMDPKEISERTGFPYDEETGNFTVRLREALIWFHSRTTRFSL